MGVKLTKRQVQVLGLLADGLSDAEIASQLGIEESTVKTHLTWIYAKLGVPNRAGAVGAGYQRRILTIPSIGG